jgi:FkbM family methyltransferase
MIKKTKGMIVNKMPDWVYIRLCSWIRKQKIVKTNIGWSITNKDMKLYSPILRFCPFTLDEFELKFEKYFKINQGDTVLDVGACIGDTTLPIAMKAGYSGKIIAVEPNLSNIKFLQFNLVAYKNIEIIQKGIWNNRGYLNLHLHPTPTGHSIIPHKTRNIGYVPIEVDTLDNLFSNTKIDFAKIDIQGAELAVFKTGIKFLQNVDKLVVEAHHQTEYHRDTHDYLLELLSRYYKNIRYSSEYNLVYAWRR